MSAIEHEAELLVLEVSANQLHETAVLGGMFRVQNCLD